MQLSDPFILLAVPGEAARAPYSTGARMSEVSHSSARSLVGRPKNPLEWVPKRVGVGSTRDHGLETKRVEQSGCHLLRSPVVG